jgi:triacylglycerol esterase/lipase EstA (alpha/beta hydrolase family)
VHCRAEIRFHTGSYALLSDQQATDALVFVHGFAGNASTTWVDFQSQVDAVEHEDAFERCDLYFFGYNSTGRTVEQSAERLGQFIEDVVAGVSADTFRLWLPRTSNWSRVAKPALLDRFNRRYERIILIAHSLGGVVARRLIMNAVSGSRHWAKSHARVIASSPILFAPALKGFRHEVTVGHAISSAQLLTLAFAVWALTKGKVYPDVLQSAKTLDILEKQTEQAHEKPDSPASLKATVYWGVDEEIVIPGSYLHDVEHKEPHHAHVDICKPLADFLKPIVWVANGIQ